MAGQPQPITDPVEALIAYFVSKLRGKRQPMGRTKLVKLLYFADLYHLELFGSQITDLSYYHYKHGPFSGGVYEAMGRLQEAGILAEREVTTAGGHKAYILRPTVSRATIRMSSSVRETADIVLEEWGSATAKQIEKAAKATIPFLRADFEQKLDLSDNSLDELYRDMHGLRSPAAAATELVAGNKKLMDQIRAAEKESAARR
jgi:uncharacterized phage-associated protein